jgi:hypothetical protein
VNRANGRASVENEHPEELHAMKTKKAAMVFPMAAFFEFGLRLAPSCVASSQVEKS